LFGHFRDEQMEKNRKAAHFNQANGAHIDVPVIFERHSYFCQLS